MTAYNMEAAVEAGAALLDRVFDATYDSWADKIDEDDLHMAVCGECILGQLYGDYLIGLARVGLPSHGIHDSDANSEAVQYGFYLPLGADDADADGSLVRVPGWTLLGNLWRRQIEARLP